MPFGLKNEGATCRRLVNCMFSHQIGRNVEVYIDDMLLKSKDEANHLDNLKETFSTLCKYSMKLNATKCVFAVVLGKFLGYMVSQRGIEANPDNNQGQITKNSEGGSELDKKGCSSKQIRLQGNGQVHTILQGFEKGLLVD